MERKEFIEWAKKTFEESIETKEMIDIMTKEFKPIVTALAGSQNATYLSIADIENLAIEFVKISYEKVLKELNIKKIGD